MWYLIKYDPLQTIHNVKVFKTTNMFSMLSNPTIISVPTHVNDDIQVHPVRLL